MIRINKKIIEFYDFKKSLTHNLSCTNPSIFCLLEFLFLISLIITFSEDQYTIVNIVLANEINGTENADNITGTEDQDTIKALNGNDMITGKKAGDDISGGSGDDIIYGNEGRDVLNGKAGNDRIDGGEGNDRLYGYRGNDILVAGPGNDTLTGGPGKDTFICGTGSDTLVDFNTTQKDTIPQDDCEKTKYGNTKYFIILQGEQLNNSNTENKESKIIMHNEQTSVDEKKSNSSFLFTLFK